MLDVELLVEQHGKAIYGLCRKLTGSVHDADDLYQQTFLVAMGKKICDDGNPRAFLSKICITLWKGEQRKRFRRSRIAPQEELEPERIAACGEISADLEKQELYDAVRSIVAALDEKFRLPVLLYYGMELPLKEIAQTLGCPEGTVKSRLSSARKIMKEKLEVKGYDG